MRFAFLYTRGRLRRSEKVRSGIAPTDFFYGSEELRALGHEICLFELPENATRSAVGRLADIFNAHLPMKVTGTQLDQMRPLTAAISRCDVLVVAGSGLAFVADMWRILGKIRCPVVGIHCGLLNVKYAPIRKWATSFLLNRTWSMLFGDGEFRPLIKFFRVDSQRVCVNQCGIDTDFWTPATDENVSAGDYVLAVGNDGRRDYDLLIEAAARCKEAFIIVTRAAIAGAVPPNVKIITGDFRDEILSDLELRDLYRRARCVVTPLIESKQPSGQSVCLQAMACGRPVILTRTEGLWSEALMRDNENVVLVPSHDVDAMTAAIERVCSDPQLGERLGRAGRETVCRDWTMRHYAKRLEDFVRTKVLRIASAPQPGELLSPKA
jgi:glycosyltransferase involved in cell wall biosynthesis